MAILRQQRRGGWIIGLATLPFDPNRYNRALFKGATVRPTVRTLLPLMLVLMTACDPGMTIRQNAASAGNGANPSVAIHVKASHPLISETWYAPGVEITNQSDSPITVTSVELYAQHATIHNKPRRSGTYPLEIPAKGTETLDVWFDLADTVKKTFHDPAELRMYYRSGSKEQIAQTSLIGGRLDTGTR
jgi:hypothetical protein